MIQSPIREDISDYFKRVRAHSEQLCSPLEVEDFGVQSMPDASPIKWHLAHTSWFYETMLLKPFLADYSPFSDAFAHLFNSYYESFGSFHTRAERGLLSRPTVREVYAYRAHIDQAMRTLLADEAHADRTSILERTVLGLNHEQQHQELMLTDIKHAFFKNPLRPAYQPAPEAPPSDVQLSDAQAAGTTASATTDQPPPPASWLTFEGGLVEIGHSGKAFAYDNEMPRHKVYLEPYALAPAPVTNGDYRAFVEAGGYRDADLWLSDAWALVKEGHWCAPFYWEKRDGAWWHHTLQGMQPVDMAAPVAHVSFYEAAAFARWHGKRLPTEAEWEHAAARYAPEGIPVGNLAGNAASNAADSGHYAPRAADGTNRHFQFFGDVWEWTASPYTEYPGYQRLSGPLGEYNGKFMSSQMVLRGGSCVTPADHIRPGYRNFFPPHTRWQFSGLRLAADA
jgi:ergothioneine biosynthesis protein EgtB